MIWHCLTSAVGGALSVLVYRESIAHIGLHVD